MKAHVLLPDGTYARIDKRGKTRVDSQEQFCEEAVMAGGTKTDVYEARRFVPAETVE